MGNKIKLQKMGGQSLWLLNTVAKGGFKLTDLLITSYIQAFFVRSLTPIAGRGYLEQLIEKMITDGLVSKSNQSNKLTLTAQGNWELARRRYLDNPESHTRDGWDRKWRIVIFDIPEMHRNNRDKLRYAIKAYGMYQLQQSVWVYPYSCDKFIQSIKEDLGFQAEVLSLIADSIENQSKLEEEFGLV